jgi:hypothetical protein
MNGRLVRREQLVARTGTAAFQVSNVSSVPPGMYLLNFDMNNTKTTIKVLKQ